MYDDEFSEDDAHQFIVKVVAGVASTILKNRCVVSKESLARRSIGEYEVPFLKKTTEAGIAFWNIMKGISDAIGKRCLREVIVVTTAGDREEDELFEAYTVTIYYPQHGERIVVKSAEGKELTVLAYEGRRSSLGRITNMLPPLPNYAVGHVRLTYFESTPRDYNPPGFIRTKDVSKLALRLSSIDFGAINCGYFGCSVRVGLPSTVISSCLAAESAARSIHSDHAEPAMEEVPSLQSKQMVVEGDADGHSTAETLEGPAAALSKVTVTPTSGLGTMTVDSRMRTTTVSHHSTSPVYSSDKHVDSAENVVEASRAEDHSRPSSSPEAFGELLVRQVTMGREKMRRFDAKKKRQLSEHEAAYRAFAVDIIYEAKLADPKERSMPSLGLWSMTTDKDSNANHSRSETAVEDECNFKTAIESPSCSDLRTAVEVDLYVPSK
ncbi:unnamed protein product [Toxocara canis]|uniref:HORMA domain-containing protein n=1 Tax=Toxocara canis TaxID=6265 RepID=A0A183V163_TOXCA|nr:unnamed protein product [Toxocara canis]